MNRTAFNLTLITLVLSLLWLALMFATLSSAGPLYSFEQILAHVANPGRVYFWNYLNAALLTISVSGFFAALYRIVRSATPTRAGVGLTFVPVYCVINLFCYLSQVTIVPALAAGLAQPETAPIARLLLAELVHEWPVSTVAFFNALAYALLGIPSILYGLALFRESGALRAGGLLLALNGAACVLGVTGLLLNISTLALATLIGGGLFTAALPLIAFGLRE